MCVLCLVAGARSWQVLLLQHTSLQVTPKQRLDHLHHHQTRCTQSTPHLQHICQNHQTGCICRNIYRLHRSCLANPCHLTNTQHRSGGFWIFNSRSEQGSTHTLDSLEAISRKYQSRLSDQHRVRQTVSGGAKSTDTSQHSSHTASTPKFRYTWCRPAATWSHLANYFAQINCCTLVCRCRNGLRRLPY